MPGFANVLSEADSKAIQAYVANAAAEAIAFCESDYPQRYPELLATGLHEARRGMARLRGPQPRPGRDAARWLGASLACD